MPTSNVSGVMVPINDQVSIFNGSIVLSTMETGSYEVSHPEINHFMASGDINSMYDNRFLLNYGGGPS